MTPSARRRLILTADDFGISPAVNEAVVRAFREGLLRFASLMVAGQAAVDAVERARSECPGLGVGLHVVLCQGDSVSRPEQITGLVDSKGRFPDDPVLCGLRYFFDRGLRFALEREMRAQFESFLSAGFPPSHVDGHVNIHVHPVVFPILMRLAREYGFKRVRLPGGEFGASLAYSMRPLAKQLAEGLVFAALRRYLLRRHGDARLAVPERTFGLLRSGMMGIDYVLHALDKLPEGSTEIYFHPSADPASAFTDRPRPGHHTISELETLLSPRLRDALKKGGFELATASELSDYPRG